MVGRSLALSVCLLVTFVSPAKTAEPIEMPLGVVTRMDPRNHVLDWGEDPSRGRGDFLGWGEVATHCKQRSSQQRIGVMREVASAICRFAAPS